MSKAKGLFKRLTYRLTDSIPDEKFVLFICQLIQRRVNNSLPSRALKVLFSLDAMLYEIQGEQAVLYDGGIHTKHRHMKYHDFFVNRITNQDRVMDIGCGIGAVANDVAQVAGLRSGDGFQRDQHQDGGAKDTNATILSFAWETR